MTQAMDIEAFGTIGMILGLLVGGIGTALAIWFHAPPVGGEWFFYIKVLAIIVSAPIGAQIGAIGFAVLGGILAMVID